MKKAGVVVVGGGWFHFCISAFTVPDFRNKSQWMEKREKTEKACHGWMVCSVPWVGFSAVSVNG